ncbi:C6 transcription factor [Naviculisporaceae sp. PSN 640]
MNIHQQPIGYDAEQEETSRRKRRAITQGQKACNPCRARKVRCSYQLPCQTCVDRQHPHLCIYNEPQKRVSLSPAVSAASSATTSSMLPSPGPPSKQDWEKLMAKIESMDQALQSVRKELARRPARGSVSGGFAGSESPQHDEAGSTSDAAASGDHDQHVVLSVHPVSGESVFLGANSVPAMAVALSQQPANDSTMVRDLLDKSVLPIFTLENDSTTYPFVDLWGLPHASPVRVEKLCTMLPSDSECLQYIRQYRDTAHVLFPGIVNIQQFEVEVTRFLVTRTTQSRSVDPNTRQPLTEQNVYGKSVHWLGLLFACLASGYQCSNLPRRERQLTSQVYVCCAYECLRIINYLSCCQLDDLQNLLVLGNVISNSMNAGVAWTLLGLTIRLAQGLGLNHERKPHSQGPGTQDSALRHEIWSRIIWQDSLLSISYDRVTPTGNLTGWDTAHPARPDDGFSYADCMLQLCTIALDVVRRRAQPTSTQHELQRIQECRRDLQSITEQAHIHLRESSACALMKDHLEHWNWRMHYSYVVSELCRPMLAKREHRQAYKKGHSSTTTAVTIAELRRLCIDALIDTVDAFLKLQNLTFFARTSWAAVHRSLGSALLLGILKEPARNEHVRAMIAQLIAVMSNLEYTDASEMPAPVTRAVEALQRLNSTAENSMGGPGRGGDGERDQQDMGLDETEIVSPQPTETTSTGDSPHAQMQRILWGADIDAMHFGVGADDFLLPGTGAPASN